MIRPVRLLCLVAIILWCLLQTGCWDALPVENRAIVLALGIDYLPDEDLIEVTVVYPLTDDTKARPSSVTAIRGRSVSEALTSFHHTSDRTLSLAMVTTIVFGREAAAQGVVDHIHDLYGYPDLRTAANVITTPGTARELLSVTPPETLRVAVFLHAVISRGQKQGDIPRTSLASISSELVTPGIDPLTGLLGPIGRLSPAQGEASTPQAGEAAGQPGGAGMSFFTSEEIQVVGASLWALDKVVGTISLPELQHLLLATFGHTYLPLHVILDEDELFTGKAGHIMLTVEQAAPRWELCYGELLNVKLNLTLQMTINSYQGKTEIIADDNIGVLEGLLEAGLNAEIASTLQKVSSLGSDPLALGQKFRVKYPREWKPEQWRDMLKTIQFTVDTTVRINNVGIHVHRLEPR